jgi:beta-glucosidase
VKDLLARMTLAEKAAQMTCIWRQKSDLLLDRNGRFNPVKARKHFGHGHGLGQVGRPSEAGRGQSPRRTAELTNAIQQFFMEHSRLGIPVLFHEECLHGHAAPGATSFPQPIGLAATFNPDLVEELYAMAARETRVRGAHQVLTPVVDVARDPRWGRVEETFGEDPYLVAQLASASIRGFQGDATFRDPTRVIATVKHFAAHGQPEAGMNCGPVNVSMRELREVFLNPFKACIQQAGAIGVMASYNEIDGVPSHANEWLLRDVLRREWGFKGFVVSDYYGVRELSHRPETHGHFVARDGREACALAVRAGINVEYPDPDCYLHIEDLVRKGVVAEPDLDALIAPLLLWKFKLGLFERPYVDPLEAQTVAGNENHRTPALQAARETITLLKNQGHLAPLNLRKLQTLAVIGPNAHRPLLGGYSGIPRFHTTVLEGIRARVGDRARVLHAEGCPITLGGSWTRDRVTRSHPQTDARLIRKAVQIARRADVVILAIGGNEQTSREAWTRTHLGDRASLDLVGRQEQLIQALLDTGKPIIALLFNGQPIANETLFERVPTIFECWYLGQECGVAVAEVLFGDYNPGGKLPISLPRSAGHLPAFYNHKPSSRRGYLFDEVSPWFPFGHGLSYTRFRFDKVRLSRKRIRRGAGTRVHVDVTNTGRRAGTEVVQLYIRDCVSSVTRPVKELKGFRKLFLKPHETRTVTLDIPANSLSFYDLKMNPVIEPGTFEIMVGNSSRDEALQRVILTVT